MVTNELVHVCGDTVTAGFKVFRLPKVKLRGRPPVYNGTHRRQVAAALKKHGFTHGLKYLKKEKGLKVSLTLARAVAKEYGLTFERGRRKVKVA
jgi:transposase